MVKRIFGICMRRVLIFVICSVRYSAQHDPQDIASNVDSLPRNAMGVTHKRRDGITHDDERTNWDFVMPARQNRLQAGQVVLEVDFDITRVVDGDC